MLNNSVKLSIIYKSFLKISPYISELFITYNICPLIIAKKQTPKTYRIIQKILSVEFVPEISPTPTVVITVLVK